MVELTFARADWIWSYVDWSPVGVLRQIEDQTIANAPPPRILILGNSRLLSVPSAALADAMGLEATDVLNVAITEGDPFDCLNIYRRNRSRLSDSEIVIVGLDTWQVRQFRKLGNDRIRRYATLSERHAGFQLGDRIQLIISSVWRTIDAYKAIARTGRAALLGGRRRNVIAPDGRSRWRTSESEDDIGPETVEISARVEAFYSNWARGTGSLAPLEELLGMLAEDEARVIFVRAPLRDRFVEEVRRDYPDSEQAFEDLEQWCQGRGFNVSTITYGSASSVGLTNQDFMDYGHFTISGGSRFARILAEDVQELLAE